MTRSNIARWFDNFICSFFEEPRNFKIENYNEIDKDSPHQSWPVYTVHESILNMGVGVLQILYLGENYLSHAENEAPLLSAYLAYTNPWA